MRSLWAPTVSTQISKIGTWSLEHQNYPSFAYPQINNCTHHIKKKNEIFPKGSPKLKITDKIKDKKNQLKPSFLVDNIYKYYLTQPILNYPKFLTKYFYLIIFIIFSFLSTFFLSFLLSFFCLSIFLFCFISSFT